MTKPNIFIDTNHDNRLVIVFPGETIVLSLDDVLWLRDASLKERSHFEIDPTGIYWPDLDDGIDYEWARRMGYSNAAGGRYGKDGE
jgi:hypothetical protein